MSVFFVECPCPCGVRFPVDSQTMRKVQPEPAMPLVALCDKCNQIIARCWCRPDAA